IVFLSRSILVSPRSLHIPSPTSGCKGAPCFDTRARGSDAHHRPRGTRRSCVPTTSAITFRVVLDAVHFAWQSRQPPPIHSGYALTGEDVAPLQECRVHEYPFYPMM